MRIEVTTTIDAPVATVWSVLTDWERQPTWMVDARAVEVLTPFRDGLGVTLRCPTNVLGVTVEDVMRVTAWEPPTRLEVVHLGRVIQGGGAFELSAHGPQTMLTWWEEVDPPLGRLGAVGADLVVRPFVTRLFRRSLANLARLAEQEAAGDPGDRAASRNP